jgi:hypothetical protein
MTLLISLGLYFPHQTSCQPSAAELNSPPVEQNPNAFPEPPPRSPPNGWSFLPRDPWKLSDITLKVSNHTIDRKAFD